MIYSQRKKEATESVQQLVFFFQAKKRSSSGSLTLHSSLFPRIEYLLVAMTSYKLSFTILGIRLPVNLPIGAGSISSMIRTAASPLIWNFPLLSTTTMDEMSSLSRPHESNRSLPMSLCRGAYLVSKVSNIWL